MPRCSILVFALVFSAMLRAEERSFNDEIEYLPDAAATEAARKGERQAKRIQQRRKERGTAGRIGVDTPRYVSQLRADERAARHAKRSEFVQVILDAFSDPRVRVLPVLTRKSVGLGVRISLGKPKPGEKQEEDSFDDVFGWMNDEPDEEEAAPNARRSAQRWSPLTANEKKYIERDSDQRANRRKLRERQQERQRDR